jgi:hypothetical protein
VGKRTLIVVVAWLVAVLVSSIARPARAEGHGAYAEGECSGPPECCITDRELVKIPLPEDVRVGLRIMRISKISERESQFSADIYVMRRWPAGGLKPNLSLRNVDETPNVVEDRLDSVGGFCYDARRIQDDFDTTFLLRRFPFDRQNLHMIFEDETWDPKSINYSNDLWPMSISSEAFRDMQSWRYLDYPTVSQRDAHFRFHPGDIPSRLLLVDIPVEREWKFYLSRYFFPLLLIVALSYSLFYIKPDDLASASGIGITAVLAIIAFQITQADTLPKVGYLTLADKVYTVCYLFTAGALALIIHGAWLATHGGEERANKLYRRYRTFFPILFVLLFGGAAAWGWMAGYSETDVPEHVLAPAAVPPGEHEY